MELNFTAIELMAWKQKWLYAVEFIESKELFDEFSVYYEKRIHMHEEDIKNMIKQTEAGQHAKVSTDNE